MDKGASGIAGPLGRVLFVILSQITHIKQQVWPVHVTLSLQLKV